VYVQGSGLLWQATGPREAVLNQRIHGGIKARENKIEAASAAAQTPVADLAQPPADARHFIIESGAGKHGDAGSWIAADGTRLGRDSMSLRGGDRRELSKKAGAQLAPHGNDRPDVQHTECDQGIISNRTEGDPE